MMLSELAAEHITEVTWPSIAMIISTCAGMPRRPVLPAFAEEQALSALYRGRQDHHLMHVEMNCCCGGR